METVLINFIQILRRCGLRVSVSESLDGARAAALLGVGERPAFKAALRAALIKREKDIPLFDEIFEAYWTDNPSDIPLEELFGKGLSATGEDEGDLDEALQQAIEQMGGLDELTEALLDGNLQIIRAEMLQHMTPEQLAELRSMLQRGQLVQIILDRMGWQRIQEQLQQLIRQLQQQGDFEAAHRVAERLWELQELFPKWVRNEVSDAVQKQFQSQRPPTAPRSDDLMHKPFAQYSEAELRMMEEIVDQLARKLRKDWARRARAGGQRRLDVPRTLRHAQGTFGVPVELRWKQRRRNRLNLVVLCDVSSSVRNASRFMLQLVYSLQQQRGRVRSFVFISDIDEVTNTFARNNIDEAVRLATSEAAIMYWSHSDFGRAFRLFLDDYGDALSSRTTVIVLGDGRSNLYDPQLDALQEIGERSRQIVWLNPEGREYWGWGDSIAPLYAQFCDSMVECRNLAQLTTVMESIISNVA